MKTKATSMMRRNDGCSSFRQSALFIAAVALGTATAVHAADCYWAGGTSSAWETAGNWTTTAKKPTNDGAYFRKDKFADRFKNDKYVVTFSAAETNNWRTYFNDCGTASAPIVLRGSNVSRRRLRSSCGQTTPRAALQAATQPIAMLKIMKASTSARTRPEATAATLTAKPRPATHTCVSSRERTRRATPTATSYSATIRMTAI